MSKWDKLTTEETAENIIACWENSDKNYAHLQTLIVRGIKHQRQSARAVADLENETLENRIKELEAIIENGLGPEDLKTDIKYPTGE